MILKNEKNRFKTITRPIYKNAIRPSNFPSIFHCQGSALLQHKHQYEDTIDEIAIKGLEMHKKAAENIISIFKNKHLEYDIYPADYEFVRDYVANNISYFKNEVVLVEENLKDSYNNMDIYGTVDFLSWDCGTLVVKDLKTGFKKPSDEAFYQLYFYALAFINMTNISPHFIYLKICTRYGPYIREISLNDLRSFKAEMASKLTSFTFTTGAHCANCFQFKNCTLVQDQIYTLLSDTLDNKNRIKEILLYKEVINKFYKVTEAKIKAKYISSENDEASLSIFKKKYPYAQIKKTLKDIWNPAKEALIPTKTVTSQMTPLQAKKAGKNLEQLKKDKILLTKDEYKLTIKEKL